MLTQNTVGAIGAARVAVGTNPNNLAEPLAGSQNVSELLGRYSSLAVQGKLYSAFGLITSGVIYSTAAGTGGPLLWNNTNNVAAHILAVLIGGVTTANTVASSIGLTGNTGQTQIPSSTTPIDAVGNCLVGGSPNQINVYRIGTVTNAGSRFMPLAQYGTGAITVGNTGMGWVDVGGSFIIPPNCWGAVSFGATATTGVIQLGVLWAELPA